MKSKIHNLVLALGFASLLLLWFTPSAVLAGPGGIPDLDPNSSTQSSTPPKYQGVEDSIKQFLCVPSDDKKGVELFSCVQKVYSFGIAFGAIALVFFVVLAGYFYIAGGESGKQNAKSMVYSSLVGMGLILSSWVLLNFINPNLTNFKPIQPPVFTTKNLPSCAEVFYTENCIINPDSNGSGQVYYAGGGGGKTCAPVPSGPASIANLSKTCWAEFGADTVKYASIVANAESGGKPIPVSKGSCKPQSLPARCVGGEIPVFGVFQINLAANTVPDGNETLNCPDAFSKGSMSFCSNGCRVTNSALYNRCYQAVQKFENEVKAACKIYQDKAGCKTNSDGTKKCNNAKGFLPWGNTGNKHAIRCGFK